MLGMWLALKKVWQVTYLYASQTRLTTEINSQYSPLRLHRMEKHAKEKDSPFVREPRRDDWEQVAASAG